MSEVDAGAIQQDKLKNSLAWFVCLSAGLFFFYEFFQLNVFDVINQSLRDSFHLNASEVSWMSSMYLWADILFLIPAGILLDRCSVRTVILAAMSVCVFGTLGFSLANSFALASFFHALSGVGHAFCFLSCVVLISRWFPPGKQAVVIGSVVTMAFLGGAMAHSPLAYLNEQFGWRHALWIDGMIGVVFLFWIMLAVKDEPFPSASKRANTSLPLRISLFKAVFNRQTWLAGLYTSLLNLPILVLCALWGASYLHVVHGLNDMGSSDVITLILVGSMIGCPLAGYLSDRMNARKPLMYIGSLFTMLALLPLFMGIHLSQMMLVIIFFMVGLFTSTQVIAYPLIAESNDDDVTGVATSVASVLIMGGGGLGQVVFGWMMQSHAQSTVYVASDFAYAMWMFPAAVILSFVVLFFMRETYCKKIN